MLQQITPPDPTFSAADVQAVVADSRVFEHGAVYFRGIWAQAAELPPGQHALLRALAPSAIGLDAVMLQQASGLDMATMQTALEALRQHDVVRQADEGRWYYSVELMRRWVQMALARGTL